jgi:tetratricopeptide (TPR) repeat protein
MTSITYPLNRRWSLILAVSALLLTGVMVYFPLKVLLAEFCYRRAAYDIYDSSTGYGDELVISSDTIAFYNNAIKSLEKASALIPSESTYLKALADIYTRLGKWEEIMNAMNIPSHIIVHGNRDTYHSAIEYLSKAVSLEPTNPDYHLALGQLYDAVDDDTLAEREFARAITAYPVNAPLRYALAGYYLIVGKRGKALEQARILARIDDSYLVPDSAVQKRLKREKNLRSYISDISKSYLFKALEIAWIISKDPEVIRDIAPDNPDADEIARLFIELKGIEGDPLSPR